MLKNNTQNFYCMCHKFHQIQEMNVFHLEHTHKLNLPILFKQGLFWSGMVGKMDWPKVPGVLGCEGAQFAVEVRFLLRSCDSVRVNTCKHVVRRLPSRQLCIFCCHRRDSDLSCDACLDPREVMVNGVIGSAKVGWHRS